jgi:hypothetical protein
MLVFGAPDAAQTLWSLGRPCGGRRAKPVPSRTFCDDPDEPRTASCPRVSPCCNAFTLQAEPLLFALHASRHLLMILQSVNCEILQRERIVILMPSEEAHGKLLANHGPAHPRRQQRGTCALLAAVNTTHTWDRIKTSLLWSARRDESSGRHGMYKHEAILTFF